MFQDHIHINSLKEDQDSKGYLDKEKHEDASLSSSSIGSQKLLEVIDITSEDIDAIVPTEDYEGEANTLRMWVISIVLSGVIGGVDSFFLLRYPTLHVGPIVAQLVAYPIGMLWYYIVPAWSIPLPFGKSIHLNPGPFNQKEHTCVFIMANLVDSAAMVNKNVSVEFFYFKRDIGIDRMLLLHISSFLMAFCWAGLSTDILVTPANITWPGVLSICALFPTLHSRENIPVGNWKISRLNFFVVVFFLSFVWYWFPDLIAPFFSDIGAWISWIRPENATLSQIFGVKTGLGLFPLTLDWTQVSSLNNPLTTPFWSTACIFFSFVFWIWIVMPGLYYQNHWQTAHFPIMTSAIYDVKGKSYDASKVIDSKWSLDYAKFKKYSPVMLPIAFLMNLALGLAAFSAMMVSFFFRFHEDVIGGLRNKKTDAHNVAMEKYKRFPWYFYVCIGLIALGMGFGFSGGWVDIEFSPASYIVSLVVGGGLFLPLSLIESRSNFEVALSSFFEIVAAFWFKGKPISIMFFYTMGFGTLQHAKHAASAAKVGHYMKVPPKVVMSVLLVSSVWAGLVSPAVTGYLIEHLKEVCTAEAKNDMYCRSSKTQYNSYLVWGLFGTHIYSHGGRYSWVMWFFFIGAGTASIVCLMQLKWKKNVFLQKFNTTLFFGGASNIPSVTGINYSSWAFVAFIMNIWVHRRRHGWWKKYNLVMAVGLDCGVAIAAIIIYFCVVYTGGSDGFSWWGTEVSKKGCDHTGCPHLTSKITPPEGW